MTREGAIKHAEIIKAFVEGKTIQFWQLTRESWIDIENPTFDEDVRYRVKPEPRQPREWWDNVYGTGLQAPIVRYTTKREADKCAGPHRVECIHVREVIDEEGA